MRVSWVERVVRRVAWSVGMVLVCAGRSWRWEVRRRALLVHAGFYGVFIVGLGGVLEGAAEACRRCLCRHFRVKSVR